MIEKIAEIKAEEIMIIVVIVAFGYLLFETISERIKK